MNLVDYRRDIKDRIAQLRQHKQRLQGQIQTISDQIAVLQSELDDISAYLATKNQ